MTRQTARKYMYLVKHGHFWSRDEDGVTPLDMA